MSAWNDVTSDCVIRYQRVGYINMSMAIDSAFKVSTLQPQCTVQVPSQRKDKKHKPIFLFNRLPFVPSRATETEVMITTVNAMRMQMSVSQYVYPQE